MVIKSFLAALLVVFMGAGTHGQSQLIQRSTFAAAGGVTQANNVRLSFSIGQAGVIGGHVNVRQGFQQPTTGGHALPAVPVWFPFPNPAASSFSLTHAPDGILELELCTVTGQRVHQWRTTDVDVFTLPEGLAPGVYLLVERVSGRAVRLQCLGS